MFKKAVETIVGGAVGVVALFVVAKVAYTVGQEITDVEHRYNDLASRSKKLAALENAAEKDVALVADAPPMLPKRRSTLGMLTGLKGIFGKGAPSVMGDFVSSPEEHKLEAYIHEGEIRIDIKKKAP